MKEKAIVINEIELRRILAGIKCENRWECFDCIKNIVKELSTNPEKFIKIKEKVDL